MVKQADSKFRFKHWHKIALLMALYDVVAVSGAYFMALWFRFDCAFSAIPWAFFEPFLKFTPIYCLICVAVFLLLRLYNSI